MSLAPTSTSVSAGEPPAQRLTFRLTRGRSALTKALPTTPAPGDSSRPRANTTSTGEQEADAFGIEAITVGIVAGATPIAAASNPAEANLPHIDCDRGCIRRSVMATILMRRCGIGAVSFTSVEYHGL